MKAVFLDAKTLGEDISLALLHETGAEWSFFDETKAEEILKRIKGAQIVVTNKVVLTREILKNSPELKLICVAATGYNNVDLSAAKEAGILVCNIPAYSTPSVVQLTIAFIFALATSLFSYTQASKEGRWQRSSLFCCIDYPIIELQGKKLGIIGYGQLGKQVAHFMQALGMELLIAQSRTSAAEAVPLQQLLREADVVSIHVPLTKETHHLIQRKELLLMKPSSFLINTARGGIVNEQDLADALREGIIAGAGVDVLSQEPPSATHPLLQTEIPHLLLTPHIGWASLESRKRLLAILKTNIDSFLKGSPINLIASPRDSKHFF